MTHSLIAQMAPSDLQQKALEAHGSDVVVTAGAGAGKTRVLVARFLAHLVEGLALRSIVAVTFTQKAAREMRNRIRGELGRYLQEGALAEDERACWEAVFAELDAARIGTIHSLCAEIVRAHPAELGIDPRFVVLQEAHASILQRQALEEAMAWAANDKEAATLYGALGESMLVQVLERLLPARLDAQEAFSVVDGDLLALWRDALDARKRHDLAQLDGDPAWLDAVETLQTAQPLDDSDRIVIQHRYALEALQAPQAPLDARIESQSALGAIDLRWGRQAAWGGGKEELANVKEALKGLRTLWRERQETLLLQMGDRDEAAVETLRRLRSVYDVAARRYRQLKQEQRALDFDDLEASALELLQTHPSARSRWQREVQAILVDEFQDTNGRQRDLIECLNGGRSKLFVVGDAKQSIYAFRGADVSVFRKLREKKRQQGAHDVDLDVTYRAHDGLVDGMNALLGPILGLEEDPSQPWLEPFAALNADRPKPGPGFVTPHVEIHLGIGTKGDGAMDRAADALAARLAEIVAKGGCQVRDGATCRDVNYGDVAVLCRASGSFVAYENAFERAGLPYATVAGRGFYDRPEIRDVLNSLVALADPTDDLALFGALRSPVFDVADATLYQIRTEQLDAQEPTLWGALAHLDHNMPPEEAECLARARSIIHALHRQIGRRPVADLLKAYLDATDYVAALIGAGQARSARNVTKLLSDAYASGIVSVGEFLEYIGDLRDSGAREGEARSAAQGAIQIMSVHAAKGLEFPIVVIGDVTYWPRSRNDAIVDDALGVLLPKRREEEEQSAAYCLGKRTADDKSTAEDARLLYVAATRASEKLILSGCLGQTAKGKLRKPQGWLGRMVDSGTLDLDQLSASAEELDVQAYDIPLGEETACCAYYGQAWNGRVRLDGVDAPATEPWPDAFPLLAPIPTPGGEEDDETPDRVWRIVPDVARGYAPGWVIGKLVHQALAAWRFPDEDYAAWATSMARGMGVLDRGQLDHAVRRSRALLQRFAQSAIFAEMDRAQARHHEVPYCLAPDGGAMQTGIIDALYRCEGGWQILEFKTDHVENEAALQELLCREDYVAQAERYKAAVESLLGESPSVALCLLDYDGRVVAIDPGHVTGPG